MAETVEQEEDAIKYERGYVPRCANCKMTLRTNVRVAKVGDERKYVCSPKYQVIVEDKKIVRFYIPDMLPHNFPQT